MLWSEVRCDKCGGVAIKIFRRMVYPRGQKKAKSKPTAVEFQIVCPSCGKTRIKEPAPEAES